MSVRRLFFSYTIIFTLTSGLLCGVTACESVKDVKNAEDMKTEAKALEDFLKEERKTLEDKEGIHLDSRSRSLEASLFNWSVRSPENRASLSARLNKIVSAVERLVEIASHKHMRTSSELPEFLLLRDNAKLYLSSLEKFEHSGSTAAPTAAISTLLAKDIDMEAGGLLFLEKTQSLFIVSDEMGSQGSPFWLMKANGSPQNLKMKGLGKLEDVESVTGEGDSLYALSSLSLNKDGKVEVERNLVVRFRVVGNIVQIDRALDLRTPLLAALRREPKLATIAGELDKVEVEAFQMTANDAYIALKEPQMPDGSTVILRLPELAQQIEGRDVSALNMEVFSIVRLASEHCAKPARITDMTLVNDGWLLLGNCSKIESVGQIWQLGTSTGSMPQLVTTLPNTRPEGLAVGENAVYVSTDNGTHSGSDFFQVEVPGWRVESAVDLGQDVIEEEDSSPVNPNRRPWDEDGDE